MYSSDFQLSLRPEKYREFQTITQTLKRHSCGTFYRVHLIQSSVKEQDIAAVRTDCAFCVCVWVCVWRCGCRWCLGLDV